MICGSRIPRKFRKGKSAVQYLPPLPKGCELSKACRSAVLFLNLMGLSVRKIATTLAISKKALESTLTRETIESKSRSGGPRSTSSTTDHAITLAVKAGAIRLVVVSGLEPTVL